MSSSTPQWFVQTDFGALLGPMPSDALAEMARTGALLVRDQVREGTDGDWRMASEIPGLFDEQTPSLGLLSSTLEDLFAPETSLPSGLAASRNANRNAPVKAKEPLVALESQDVEFEVDAPLIAPSKVITPPPIVVARPAHDVPQTPAPTIVPPPEPTKEVAQASPGESIGVTELVATPQPIPSWEAPVAPPPPPRWQPPIARPRPKARLGRSAWITGAIASAALLAILTAWWFWPRQRTDIYVSYVAIYKELEQRREGTQDQAGWTEFVTRAKSQLNETVPWLEERAKPGDREKSLLLYAGRDLQELLELPRGSAGPHPKRLSAFFEQLDEMYGSRK